MAVTVERGRGLRLGDRILPLVSGSVHYWRLDPSKWRTILEKVRGLGFEAVDTYVPWSAHEVAEGEFDFTGQRAVEAFIRLAGEHGLYVVVRPGPHINSETSDYGYPLRVLWDPEVQALGSAGTPVIVPSMSHYIPAPSYCSPKFLAEVQRWYEAVIPRLAALQWPDGPLVACQVDNEMAFFFHSESFALDYHPAFVDGWRTWSGLSGEPPRSGEDDPVRIDSWLRFRQHHRHEALRDLGSRIKSLGMDQVPLFHNDFSISGAWQDSGAVEASGAVDICGLDSYVSKEGAASAKAVARNAAGSSVLPYLPEFGAGCVSDIGLWFCVRILPDDEEAALLSIVCGGAVAWNFYMLVERERWYGSAISRHGELRPDDAGLYDRMHRVLRDLDWWTLDRDAPVLLLRNKDIERLADGRRVNQEATAIIAGTFEPGRFPFGLTLMDAPDGWAQRPEVVHGQFTAAWRAHLQASGLDFDEASTDTDADLSRYAAVIVASGPGCEPAIDHPNVITTLPSGDVKLPAPAFTHDGGPRVSLHHWTGSYEVLGAINETGQDVTLTLRFDGPRVLIGRWRRERTEGDGSVQVILPPYGGQLWEVERP